MASRYSKIQSTLWTSDKFNAAKEFSKIVYLYLLSCPHGNSAGFFKLPEGYATTDLKCSQQRYENAIADLKSVGLIEYDGDIVKLLENHQKPSGFGVDHWNWKGGITPQNARIRHSAEYRTWRNSVFKRDNFTCQKCYRVGGKMQAHHIKSFSLHPALRFELSNGITYCVKCHKKFHKENGVN